MVAVENVKCNELKGNGKESNTKKKGNNVLNFIAQLMFPHCMLFLEYLL